MKKNEKIENEKDANLNGKKKKIIITVISITAVLAITASMVLVFKKPYSDSNETTEKKWTTKLQEVQQNDIEKTEKNTESKVQNSKNKSDKKTNENSEKKADIKGDKINKKNKSVATDSKSKTDKMSSENTTQDSTEKTTTNTPQEKPTDDITKPRTETDTEQPTESPQGTDTKRKNDSTTEAVTNATTERPTEAVTEKPTERATEATTEKATEKPTEKTTECQHDWVAQTKIEKQLVEEGWDEDVYETRMKCAYCGKDVADGHDPGDCGELVYDPRADEWFHEGAAAVSYQKYVKTIHHPDVYEDKEVVTGYKCSKCGAVK